jgi:hypothetical protein
MAIDLGAGFVKGGLFVGAAAPPYEFNGMFRVKGAKSNSISIGRSYVLRLAPPEL